MLTDDGKSQFICGRFSSCDLNYYDIRGFKYLFSENLYIFAIDKRYLFMLVRRSLSMRLLRSY